MYRKRQQELQKMEENQQVLTRVSNYPLVKDTWTKVSEVYQRGKEGSRILKFCGDMAESSASLAYKASLPVIEKLPVGMVNDYAVQQLETLEQKYPVLVKPTEELVEDLKTYSSTKIDEAKTYGTDKFNRLAEVARLNAVLNVADSVVDRFLPPVQPTDEKPTDEKPEEQAVAKPVEASMRVRMLSDKLKRRAYDNAMAKAGTIQKRSQEAVGKLMYTVDLIDYAQQNIRSMNMEDAQEKVRSIYEEITREGDEDESLPSDANMEKKAIYVARALTKRAQSTFSTISRLSYALPSHARSAVNDAYKYSENMYQTFASATSLKDLSAQMISEIRDRLSFLEEVASNLTNYVFQAAPLRWLASSWKSEPDSPAAITNPTPAQEQTMSDDDDDETNQSMTDADDSLLNTTADDTINTTVNDDDDDVE